jgi:predicted AlkP superfamily pyrophosphatase or phosphodiesterase
MQIAQSGLPQTFSVCSCAVDLAGHDFGPFSQEVQDLVIRTDRQIADFLRWLEPRMGKEGVLVVVTADHGATPVPEQSGSDRECSVYIPNITPTSRLSRPPLGPV